MRKRASLSNRLFLILGITMVFMYLAGGVILLFWNIPSMPPDTRKIFGGILILYSIYRGFILRKKFLHVKSGRELHAWIPLILITLSFSGCTSSDKHESYTDTPTSGEILILADESYEPIVQAQIDTFMDIYKYSTIHVRYLPEAEVFKQLLNNDTVRLAIVSRELTSDEKQFFDQRKIIPRTLKIAEDAVALVVNKANTDTAITYEQLADIMNGKIIRWNQLNTGGLSDSINIVFDRSGSANARFLNERFLAGKTFPKNIYATNSNASVVDYVADNKTALGIIGVNWISDQDDSVAGEFLRKINVVGLTMPDTGTGEAEYNKPYQAYIALKKYPLLRDVLIISREGRNGLGTGFASFMAGDKGQRMIRLMGLLPATMPVRIIQVN
jgi:phosphate transport system substrate-binding protein